jgi:hypothetical protein
MSYVINDVSSADEGRLSARFMFSNIGKQAAIVDDVMLIQIAGVDVDLADCTSSRMTVAMQPRRWNANRDDVKEDKILKRLRPTTIAVDNKEASRSSLLVEPANLKTLTLIFEPEKLVALKKQTVVYCFTVTFADREGKMFTRSIPGWAVKIGSIANPMDTIWYSYSDHYQRPFQLLPVGDDYMDKGIVIGRFNPASEVFYKNED